MENNKFDFTENRIKRQASILNCYKGSDEVVKAFENDLEKGGEGSKGGKVIGHTKSGKPIYDSAKHDSHKNFTKEDHNDAIDAHQIVRDKYHKNNQSTDKDKQDNDHAYEQQKEHIGVKNSLINKEEELKQKKHKEGDEVEYEGKTYKAGKHDPSTNLRYLHDKETGKHAEDHKGDKLQVHESRVKAKKGNEGQKEDSKDIKTNSEGIHSIDHKGSTYNSKPGESKADFATRTKQAIKEDHKDDVEFKKSESIDLQKAFDILGIDIEKSQKASIGDVHEWGSKKYKKQPNGKWMQVSESHGMTKKEHEETMNNYNKQAHDGEVKDFAIRAIDKHGYERDKLSDKEYSDEELGLKSNKGN